MKCKTCGHDPEAIRCQFCPTEPTDERCGEPHEVGWECTRVIDHPGPHVACGADLADEEFPQSHLYAIWGPGTEEE